MKPEEAIEVLSNELIVITDMIGYCKDFEKESDLALAYRVKRQEAHNAAITALKEVQQYRKIGTAEEIRKTIKQGIDNCYMAHRYEHPGYEEDLCAGLRTMNGEGEPCDTCKECYLYYGNQIWGNNNEYD